MKSVLLATLWLAMTALTATASAQDRTIVSLGTATPGGGFPVYGDAFAQTINEMDPTLLVQPRNTKGSGENIPLLETGQIDIALVQGESAFEALNGIGRKPADLRIVSAMYATAGMFVVRANSPYRTIADLRGQKIAFGARSSGLVILARYILDGMGLDQDRDFQAIYLDRAGDGPAMVLDGRVAALWGGGSGWPGFVAMARSDSGARFITPGADDIERILTRHTFLKRLSLKPGTFPNQASALWSVGSWSFVMARRDLPDDTAWRLARALHRGEAALAARLPQAAETTAVNTVAALPRADLLHPGVARYLIEQGLLRQTRP